MARLPNEQRTAGKKVMADTQPNLTSYELLGYLAALALEIRQGAAAPRWARDKVTDLVASATR